jgi:Mg2+/Co2+ transporter CorC
MVHLVVLSSILLTISVKGEVIAIGTYHFIIEEATNKKIELVKLTVKSDLFCKVFFCKIKRYYYN